MPIKPENKKLYPPTWPQIRKAILQRAGNRCELCAAPNGQWISRLKECAAEYEVLDKMYAENAVQFRSIKVILTVAHLDQDYCSHDPKHLLALCQRCHLKIDRFANSMRRMANSAKSGPVSAQDQESWA